MRKRRDGENAHPFSLAELAHAARLATGERCR
jgi:hypothetical protein